MEMHGFPKDHRLPHECDTPPVTLPELQLTEWRIIAALKRTRRIIMSAISDFASKQNAHNDKIDTAIDGIQGDVTALKDLITKLQNSAGTITPEDQASLDALEARAAALEQKVTALDAQTENPPTPPTA